MDRVNVLGVGVHATDLGRAADGTAQRDAGAEATGRGRLGLRVLLGRRLLGLPAQADLLARPADQVPDHTAQHRGRNEAGPADLGSSRERTSAFRRCIQPTAAT